MIQGDLTFNHPTIQDPHPRSLRNIEGFRSDVQHLTLVPKPTRRYLKKQRLEYMCCPDCESKAVTYYGKSSVGTQKYRCKDCGHQFVAQFDAYFPKSKQYELFGTVYRNNLQRQGFREGSGRRIYWEGLFHQTMYLVSQSNRVRINVNRMIRSMSVESGRDYRLLLEFALNEAYALAIGKM